MFIHLVKYSLKMLVKNRDIMFWLLLFPIILGTLLYLLLGHSLEMEENLEMEEKFDAIPVAVVVQSEEEEYRRLLREAATDQGISLLEITETTEQRAQTLLDQGEVKGIVYVGESLSLTVPESGSVPSMLQLILNRVEQCKKLSIPCTVEKSFVTEKKATEGNMNCFMNFMYAVLAFACLLTSLTGCDRMVKGCSSVSDSGIRREVSPVGRIKGFLADFLACGIIGYGAVCILFVYMRFVLGIHIGDRYLPILLLLLVAVSSGIMMGMFVGSLPIRKEGVRLAVLTGIILICCAMDDLMIEGIRDDIEHSIPLINDINPASMISDAFYSLDVYSGYSRFLLDIARLGVAVVLFAFAGLIIKRRKRYAGL